MKFIEVRTENKPARFYIDGKRVDKESFEFNIILNNRKGKQINNSYTEGKIIKGQLKRKNVFYM